MTDQLRAVVLMGFDRFGRSYARKCARQNWVRGVLSGDPKLRQALIRLGPKHILCGGSRDKWTPPVWRQPKSYGSEA